jgi:molybdenum cofactor biosynthesis enzyme
MAKKLSHYDAAGRARMVDVSGKAATKREAEASAFVRMKPAVLQALPKNPKGDPLEVAPHRRNHGRQAHCGVDPDVPLPAALPR